MNFNQVEVQAPVVNKYLTPSVDVVKVVLVESGLSATKQSPFVKLTVENKDGLSASGEFYLNGGAFDISANTLFKYIGAAYNLDLSKEEEKTVIKSKLGEVADKEALASKLSSVLVGKPFAMVLKGKWVNPTDTSKKSWIKAELSAIVATVNNVGTLKFDEGKHISGTNVDVVTNKQTELSKSSVTNW